MNPLSLTFGTAAHASASSLHSVPMEAQLLFIGVIFLGTLIVNRFSIRIGVPAILGAREHWATATALPSTRKTRATASNQQSAISNQQSKPDTSIQAETYAAIKSSIYPLQWIILRLRHSSAQPFNQLSFLPY